MRPTTDVLVVGAGPTGLTLALQAVTHGAQVRVADQRQDAARPSRAMILHPSTLERLRPLGVVDELLNRADRSPRAALHAGRRSIQVELGRLAIPDTPFPHVTLVRQADVERVLIDRLSALGVSVERGVRFRGVDAPSTGAPRATLTTMTGNRRVVSRFLVGCDGPASAVRRTAGIGWRGGPYPVEVVLADVDLDGGLDPGVLHVVVGRNGLVFLFALGETAAWRLLATRSATGPAPEPAAFGQPGAPVRTGEIRQLLDASPLDVSVARQGWSAVVPLQHRLADAYRAGSVFLAGDAAHTHSPAGGLGMNTGIQDAVNLGWKLAFAAARGGGGRLLLDSYDQERRPVARQVRALTDPVFFAEASTHPVAGLLRGWLAPRAAPALPFLLRHPRLVAEGYRFLAQLRVHYRDSPLSREGTPLAGSGPQPGDRLADRVARCGGRATRLHDLTARPGVHVFLSRDATDLGQPDLGDLVSVHRLTDQPGQDLLAVRPDGFVGLRCGRSDAAQLLAWLDSVNAR